MARHLGADERALWARVIETVRPLHPQSRQEPPPAAQAEAKPPAPKPRVRASAIPAKQPARTAPGTTLDGSWDKRLSRGLVQPDLVVDLHGHSLSTAYSHLDQRLEQAVMSEARILLLITGKAPEGERWPIKRGAIRAAVGDWLAASRHAGDIAAVRSAHPRHGGAGALYIVLRRRRRR